MSARSLRPACWNCAIESLRCLISFSTTASTALSSSSTRSSTSRCLIAASSKRMVPRRSVSRARMAVFMSSLIRALRDIVIFQKVGGHLHMAADAARCKAQTQKPAEHTPQRVRGKREAVCQYSFFGSIWLRMRL
ncbi:conserved protein of unknown function [Cupriavidus neocaledonicus]|uniref:Uncharacterized protein n=1 Tax=Cupriavidus neocaledonicus TaxID=1040979 RepID=A0A375H9L8_9BURK|nr:hypothetical protein CBM2605_A190112 [Cupriavidus neocaledonicus]SPD47578.1 conserved protein of unknown function [Cupriavidus neocaledonicus]